MNANLSRKFRTKDAVIGVVVMSLFALSGYGQATGRDAPKPAPAVSRGGGVGAANGSGVGTSSGTAVGGANGSSVGRPATVNIVILPSEMQRVKASNRRVNATDLKLGSGIGTNAGRGIAPGEASVTTGSGTGSASGNGTAGGGTPVFRAEPVTKTYIQELDGSCYYVTNLGAKRYVAKAKCSIE